MLNPTKPAKVRRVLNGAAKIQKALLNNSLQTGTDMLQNLMHTLLLFHEQKRACSFNRCFGTKSAVHPIFEAGLPQRRHCGLPIFATQSWRKRLPHVSELCATGTAADNAVSFDDAARGVTLNFLHSRLLGFPPHS